MLSGGDLLTHLSPVPAALRAQREGKDTPVPRVPVQEPSLTWEVCPELSENDAACPSPGPDREQHSQSSPCTPCLSKAPLSGWFVWQTPELMDLVGAMQAELVWPPQNDCTVTSDRTGHTGPHPAAPGALRDGGGSDEVDVALQGWIRPC